MWWLRRLTLFAALIATACSSGAAAADLVGGAVRTALHHGAAVRGQVAETPAELRALRLPAGGALAFAQPLVRASVAGDRLGLRAFGAPLEAGREVAPVATPGAAEEARLSFPVSSRMSLGVGYSYVTSEDLAFEVAETGSLERDYDSHNVLIRAHWQF